MRMATLVLCLTCLLFTAQVVTADTKSPADAITIEKVEISQAGTVALKIDFVNSAELGALTIPLRVSDAGTKIDSISFAGGRLAYIKAKPVTIAKDQRQVVFGAICMTEDYIAPGSGHLATVYLSVADPIADKQITVDTITVVPATLLFTKSNSLSYVPEFTAGIISAAKPAAKPAADSAKK